MAEVPSLDKFAAPSLRFMGDGKEHALKDIVNHVAKDVFGLSQSALEKTISSGQNVYRNRGNWAVYYLKMANLIVSTKRGQYKISQKGIEFLKNGQDKALNWKKLDELMSKADSIDKNEVPSNSKKTPEESIDDSFQAIEEKVCSDLLDRVRRQTPDFFEKLVVNLIQAMGYGWNPSKSGKVVGQSHDGGIDGIINQDRLGLDKIYIQAKRYDEGNSIPATQVRDFVGTIRSKGSKKGIFITTSTFSKEARDFITSSKDDSNVVLIDGDKVAHLMYEYNIGVSTAKAYTLKKVDTDFFDE